MVLFFISHSFNAIVHFCQSDTEEYQLAGEQKSKVEHLSAKNPDVFPETRNKTQNGC